MTDFAARLDRAIARAVAEARISGWPKRGGRGAEPDAARHGRGPAPQAGIRRAVTPPA